MRRTIVGAILLCLSLNASAADDSVFGTHWAKFQPIQVEGDVQGCQLTFLTVTADRVYLDGNQVAVNGSIRIGKNWGQTTVSSVSCRSAYHSSRVGKGRQAVPTRNGARTSVGTLRFAHPTSSASGIAQNHGFSCFRTLSAPWQRQPDNASPLHRWPAATGRPAAGRRGHCRPPR